MMRLSFYMYKKNKQAFRLLIFELRYDYYS